MFEGVFAYPWSKANAILDSDDYPAENLRMSKCEGEGLRKYKVERPAELSNMLTAKLSSICLSV